MSHYLAAVSVLIAMAVNSSPAASAEADLPANTWVKLAKDTTGARRGCAVRFAPAAGKFFLWGFMDNDPEFRQEQPAMSVPEYDMVAFDLNARRWRGHLPKPWAKAWRKKLPPTWVPRAYHAVTSGSERSLFRPPAGYPVEASRPDPNITFDQAAYHPPTRSLIYFTGGLTVAYHPERRGWSNLAPDHSPPPVLGGSLAYDPIHDEMVLFGGGHVAEKRADGRVVGHTGTWIYSFAKKDWRPLATKLQPPPRMYSRLVCDTKNKVLVLFGGDSQSHYLADTWVFDLKTRRWRQSKAQGGPPPRAGHFVVYDPGTSWVIIGGGFNRENLTDMWAFDAAADRWTRLKGETPTGAWITADIAPGQSLLVLVSNTRAPGHRRNCDIMYAIRTTFAYRIDKDTIARPDPPKAHQPLPKRVLTDGAGARPDPERAKAQARRLDSLPVNRWVLLEKPGRTAPVRSWGSATFDSDRSRILLWGGGHCSYGGSDVDAYDVKSHTWISSARTPEYPHRLWAKGVRLAGVTFAGNPWSTHGRRIYAYDPTCRKMIAVRPIRLTTGYEPAGLRGFPGKPRARADAKVKPPTSYNKYVSWTFDPDTGQWNVAGPAPAGLDTLVTTRHGVMGVNVDWPTRLNDAGYQLSPQPPKDNALFHYDPAQKQWTRLGKPQPSPQNLYEMTGLAYDSRRDRVLLHGGGKERDELWAFDLKSKRWQNLKPKVSAAAGSQPPTCQRELVYLPGQDVLLTLGRSRKDRAVPAFWVYRCRDNAWYRMAIDPPPGVSPRNAAGQNRAVVYDPGRDLILLVLGSNDRGRSLVHAMRYRHDRAKPYGVEKP